MLLPERVAEYRRSQAETTSTVVLSARRLWATLGDGDWDREWLAIAPQLTSVVTAGQVAAGTKAATYIDAEVAELGLTDDQQARVSPRGLAGVASDGLPLNGLLYMPVVESRIFADPKKLSTSQALAHGQNVLDRIVSTQMADAKRAAESVQMQTYPHVQYAERVVHPPCCPRCAVLAGMRVRLENAGFERHPACDCGFRPVGSTTKPYTDAGDLFKDGQIRGLSKADAQAISDGADPGQVINAHRGMKTADRNYVNVAKGTKYTSEGTTRRGLAGRLMRQRHAAAEAYAREVDEVNRVVRNARRRQERGATVDWSQIRTTPRRHMPVRLRPETIYRLAPDRDEALRMLRLYGYII